MSRITLEDTDISAIMKMVDGNPGAISVLTSLLREEGKIDPDSAFGGIGTILALDDLEIYGPNIWVLFKDVCKSNITNLVTLFRAKQLGFVSSSSIKSASTYERFGENRPNFDFVDLYSKVKERLPNFGVNYNAT